MPANFFSRTEQPDPIRSSIQYRIAFTELDVVIREAKLKIKALGEATVREHQENLVNQRTDNFLSAAEKRQFFSIMVENLKVFKNQVFYDAHHTFKDDPAGTARLAHNIKQVNTAIFIVLNDDESRENKIVAINDLRYKASRWEPTFTTLKKIVRVLCAAAIGFLLGAVAGTTLSGGIAALPTAIMMSFKNTLAAYAGGAGAAVAFGPSFDAAMSAKEEFKQKTNSPVERSMVRIQNSLKNTLEPTPFRSDVLTRAINSVFKKQKTFVISEDSDNSVARLLSPTK